MRGKRHPDVCVCMHALSLGGAPDRKMPTMLRLGGERRKKKFSKRNEDFKTIDDDVEGVFCLCCGKSWLTAPPGSLQTDLHTRFPSLFRAGFASP